MDTQQQNLGSFGAPAEGMSDPLQEAMARRQTQGGGSPLNQVTMGSAQAQPAPTPGMGPATVQQPMTTSGGEQHPFGPENAKMVLGSLGNFLRSLTKFHGV